MKSIFMCGAIIFLQTFMLHFTLSSSGKLSVSSRLAHAVCEQRDEYSASKQIAPPLKNVPPSSSPDLTCGWFTVDKCPDCLLKFWTCAQAGKGRGISIKKGKGAGKGKGARKASKFRSVGSKIDPDLLAELQQKGGSSATIIISMVGGNAKALRSARSTSFKSRGDKITSIVQSLENLAQVSQQPVLNVIEKTKTRLSSLTVSTLWITNEIVVEDADLALVEELEKIPDVSKISKNILIQQTGNTLPDDSLPEVEADSGAESESGSKKKRKKRQETKVKFPGWHLKELEPDTIWKQNITGKGVVVGVVGMGARGSHKGLKDNFRSDHGWFDVYGSPNPVDSTPEGFGTQNLGVIVTPMNKLGLAPGAKWIACKPFQKMEAYYNDVIKCCQWILCPTDASGGNKDCAKAPHIVHGTFNVNSGPSDFTGVINAWRGANIIPVFGAGNVQDYNACTSVMTPADYNTVISVGALIKDDSEVIRRGDSSGKGPSKSGTIKPDILAPGNWLSSIGGNGDDELAPVGGTNPGGGLVAGLIALLLSEKKDLTYNQVMEILTKSAKKLEKTLGGSCGGIAETTYPNNYAGYGKVNVVTAFKYLREVIGKPPPVPSTTAAPIITTAKTLPPGPSLPPPKFSCWLAEGCENPPKLQESQLPECVIAYMPGGKINFHAQKDGQGKCDAAADKCDYCYISKCNDPKKYCKKTKMGKGAKAGKGVKSGKGAKMGKIG